SRIHPKRTEGVAATELQEAAALGPRKRYGARRQAAIQLPDELYLLGQRASERQPVHQRVVLTVTVGRIGEDAEAKISDDADRLHRLRDEHRCEEIGGVKTESLLVRR